MLIKHMLYNLVENAVQAGAATREEPLKIVISMHCQADRVLLDVVDNGPGMRSDTTLRVFDPYYTTKDEGTGLGLAIVKKIVLDHQGTISVKSEQGKGTRFQIALPLARGV